MKNLYHNYHFQGGTVFGGQVKVKRRAGIKISLLKKRLEMEGGICEIILFLIFALWLIPIYSFATDKKGVLPPDRGDLGVDFSTLLNVYECL